MSLSQHQAELFGRVLRLINEGSNGEKDSECACSASFSTLLENFVHLDFTEEEAEHHWKNILVCAAELEKKLSKPVNAHLAIVDYFTSKEHRLNSPMLIEVHVFKQTEKLAMVDSLTNVFNRRYMDIVLKKEFNRCERYNKSFSLCILDLDNFKQINDSKGHQFGDLVLVELSALIKNTIREEDVICRYGGEEFIIILPETDTAGAFYLAERVRKAVDLTPFFTDNNISFSAGTASYPACAQDITSLIRVADKALYEAKFTGKGKTCEAPPERRRFWRFPKEWEVEIFSKDANELLSTIKTKNISVGGFQFESKLSYHIDTRLNLVFKSLDKALQGAKKDITVEGTITWVNHQINGVYSYGICFTDTPEALEKAFNTGM
ncbi:MAG: diguanylate cyclase [Spirochaetaceae bacterium]|nr:diguanylate cyclase [Spirochaetaceae bacterium]